MMKHFYLKNMSSITQRWFAASAIVLALLSAGSNVMADVLEMVGGHVTYIYGEKSEQYGDLIVIRLCPDLTVVGDQTTSAEIKKACVAKPEYPRFKESFFEKLRAELIQQIAVRHKVRADELTQLILDFQFSRSACLNRSPEDCEKIMGTHYNELVVLSQKMSDVVIDFPAVLASIETEIAKYRGALAPGAPLLVVTASNDPNQFQPFLITEEFLNHWPVY